MEILSKSEVVNRFNRAFVDFEKKVHCKEVVGGAHSVKAREALRANGLPSEGDGVALELELALIKASDQKSTKEVEEEVWKSYEQGQIELKARTS